MKTLIALLLTTSLAQASILENICQNIVREDQSRPGVIYKSSPKFYKESDSVLLSITTQRDLEKFFFVVQKIENENATTLYLSSEKLNGVLKAKDSYWILKNYSLLEMGANGEFIADHNYSLRLAGSKAFSTDENNIYIAQDREGVIAFDIHNKKVAWKNVISEVFRDGHGSKPVSTAVQGDKLYVVMTGTGPNGFNGVVTLDAQTGKFITAAEYDKARSGVIGVDARVVFHNRHLIINNDGWIHIVKENDLNQRRIRPRWHSVRVDDLSYRHYMMLEGDFFFDNDDKLNGCGIYRELNPNGGPVISKAKLYKVELPL